MTDAKKPAPAAPRLEQAGAAPHPESHSGPHSAAAAAAVKQHDRSSRPPAPRKPSIHQIYALPVPLRTFPVPSFHPSNPLSLLHVLWVWAKQVLRPPPAEPSVIHQGYWSPETQSVHVRDAKSIRALWEHGFFGKGSYSRSEPNWLKREQSRQGTGSKKVAEQVTNQRREERRAMKWDRARKEQEAIARTRLEEAWRAPVGPQELLALPNSHQDLLASSSSSSSAPGRLTNESETHMSNMPLPPTPEKESNGHVVNGVDKVPFPTLDGGCPPSPPATPVAKHAVSTLKRRKSVRFSPKVESTTFQLGDPPSPYLSSPSNGKMVNGDATNGTPALPQSAEPVSVDPVTTEPPISLSPPPLVDREHLQLSPEEAFYLVFALGALSVTDPSTQKTLTSRELFHKFCQPPCPSHPAITRPVRPDDPFLVQYAVYHHFRSLGWVPRSGIKFGVDWLLYIGGPVFSHAEFAVVVLPSYSDPYWQAQGQQQPQPQPSWHWLHSVLRVQSHALKTMVLVYVDIPPPARTGEGEEEEEDPASLLKRYKIREFYVRRWVSNRNRD
ncbi:hypothetical protein F4808DRAFT_397352 [Astrocystis sublimbata]|nr:hypothetical protein F4808DRAFT_397352 [Astrocystis sublimbata]